MPCAHPWGLLHLGSDFEMITTFGVHPNLLFMGLERSLHMSKPSNCLTAQDFAKIAGVSSATVSKWLRDGTISGEKISGKWSIPPAELAKVTQSAPPAPAPGSQSPETNSAVKSYSIREFSDLTYLTEFGVQKWLKEGRLKKAVDSDGRVRIDGSSLQNPYVKRLLR